MQTTRRAFVAGTASVLATPYIAIAQGKKAINVTTLIEQTGVIAFAGQASWQAIELAVETLNASGRLGNFELKVDVKDTASAPATAAALASQVAKSDAIAILGPSFSSASMAAAPIVQREKIPMITIQSNTQGLVETGDYIYRISAPFYVFNGLTFKYLKQAGAKTIALSYLSNIPSVAGLGRDFAPKWAEAGGMKIVASEGMPSNTTDFSTTIAKLVGANADAIGLYNLDTQLTALITGVRRAGFKGQLFCYSISPATLQAVGDAADGIILSTDYSPAMKDASSADFTKRFTDKFKTLPTVYHANGYDSVIFLGAALEKLIKARKTPDRESLKGAIAEVARDGFDGASGRIRFDSAIHRDARVAGVLVRYNKGDAEVLLAGDPSREEQ